MVDVKAAPRRSLKFSCQNCIMGDVDTLAQGPVRATGNWSPGQIVQHVTDLINGSIDGFPSHMKAPLPLRLGAPFMKKRVLEKPWKPGLKLPKNFQELAPPAEVDFEEARENLRKAVGRLDTERMTAKSPVFGTMSHEDWMKLHCRHAELHFSFLHADEQNEAG